MRALTSLLCSLLLLVGIGSLAVGAETAKGTIGNIDAPGNSISVKVPSTTGKGTDIVIVHVLAGTTITLDGSPATLGTIKTGMSVTVTYEKPDSATNNATTVEVSTKKAAPKGKGKKKA